MALALEGVFSDGMAMKRQIPTADLAESLLGSGWTLRLRVSGSSMKPFLRKGSLLRIAPCSPEPTVGEIVLFRAASGRLVVHRVVGHEGEKLRTKGDSAGVSDRLVDRHQLLGRVLGVEGLLFVPLGGPLARRVGLLLNRYYPPLVRWKAALRRRLVGTTAGLAGERP